MGPRVERSPPWLLELPKLRHSRCPYISAADPGSPLPEAGRNHPRNSLRGGDAEEDIPEDTRGGTLEDPQGPQGFPRTSWGATRVPGGFPGVSGPPPGGPGGILGVPQGSPGVSRGFPAVAWGYAGGTQGNLGEPALRLGTRGWKRPDDAAAWQDIMYSAAIGNW